MSFTGSIDFSVLFLTSMSDFIEISFAGYYFDYLWTFRCDLFTLIFVFVCVCVFSVDFGIFEVLSIR